MRLLLCASFITLIALLIFGTSASAKTLEDRCLPAVGTAIYRYGIAYSRIIQEGQAQSDIRAPRKIPTAFRDPIESGIIDAGIGVGPWGRWVFSTSRTGMPG
jgi:hypothetical protein